MKRNDFAIFVLSHHRAIEGNTAQWVSEYTEYPVYTVVDDQDKQLGVYKRDFRNLLIFSKEEMYPKIDTMDNFKDFSSAVYARNFILQEAKRMGYRYIMMADDDLRKFVIRYPQNGSLLSYNVGAESFDDFVAAMVGFLEDSRIVPAISTKDSHGLVGGISGATFKNRVNTYLSQCYFISVDTAEAMFSGTQDEDDNFNTDSWNNGNPVYAICLATHHTPDRGTNEGGIEYKHRYLASFYAIMRRPAGTHMSHRSNLVRFRQNVFPKVISSRWRK